MKIEQGQGQSVEQRRGAMPVVAAFIDMCRATYGAEMVDTQLAIAQQAKREHADILTQQGTVAAARWLKANAHRCTFSASEGGRTLGLASPFGLTHPPIGTPSAIGREGNSTLVATPVTAPGKSERAGVQGTSK